jgi:glycerate kinase
MRPIVARYLLRDDLAVIEMAQASGLMLLTKEERNPLVASSYGTGQLVTDAVRRGARHIVVGLGGSATSDAGMGMLDAIHQAHDIALEEVQFTIATDVRNPLCSENGAAYVFAPQKGATPEDVVALDERARRFAEDSARRFGYDRSEVAGAGAAGGLGYAFMQYMDADRTSGIRLLLDAIKFRETANGADLIITGEGSADRQTLMGKLPMGILQQAGRTPVCLIAGRVADREQLLKAGFLRVACINPKGIALETALRKDVAMRNISRTAMEIVRRALVRQS